MNNRELLETVAARVRLTWTAYDSSRGLLVCHSTPFTKDSNWWNPIDDDGDAFRLLVWYNGNLKYFRYNLEKAAELARYLLVKQIADEDNSVKD